MLRDVTAEIVKVLWRHGEEKRLYLKKKTMKNKYEIEENSICYNIFSI